MFERRKLRAEFRNSFPPNAISKHQRDFPVEKNVRCASRGSGPGPGPVPIHFYMYAPVSYFVVAFICSLCWNLAAKKRSLKTSIHHEFVWKAKKVFPEFHHRSSLNKPFINTYTVLCDQVRIQGQQFLCAIHDNCSLVRRLVALV